MKLNTLLMKKVMAIALMGLLVFPLSGCSEEENVEAYYEETEYSDYDHDGDYEDLPEDYEELPEDYEAGDYSDDESFGIVENAYLKFAQNEELQAELASEINAKNGPIPSSYVDEDMDYYEITHNGKTMKFLMEEKGERDENGLTPLYITLHGGGESNSKDNNDQWLEMFQYYNDAVENGIYIACRGITDTWDLHFQEDSYVLYDRLIEAMIVNYNVDPDRIYLLGFSAGGDGVYRIAPRLADRFAAVNMSSGHPNGVKLINLANCPISIQAGIRDYYSADAMRSVRAAEFEQTLSDYQDKYGPGYEHEVWIHVPAGHNYIDYEDSDSMVLSNPKEFADRAVTEDFLGQFMAIAESCSLDSDVTSLSYYSDGANEEFDGLMAGLITENLGLETTIENTNAVAYVSQFTRNPAPDHIVWDLSTRASKREKDTFYWLEADPSVNSGVITASFDSDTNTITVEPDEDVNGDFAILIHPDLVDMARPLTIKTKDVSKTFDIDPSADFLEKSMIENGDPKLACVEKIMYSSLTE